MIHQFEIVFALLKPGVVGFRNLMNMKAEEKLRTRLISIIQELPVSKLRELGMFLKKIAGDTKTSKERTLKMAGAWKDIDKELFLDLTERLHERRLNDRQPMDW